MNREGFSNLGPRLIWGSASLVVVLSAFVGLEYPQFHPFFALILAAISSLAVWEYYQMAKAKGTAPFEFLGIAGTAIYVLSIYCSHSMGWAEIPSMTLVAMHALFFLALFIKQVPALHSLAASSFGMLYVAYPMGLLLSLALSPSTGPFAAFWILYVVATTKISDTGAYFVGRSMGRSPLAPILSPKKTWEGVIAAVICALLTSLCFSQIGAALSLRDACILGPLVACVGQIGDLAESCIKRDAGFKDSSKIPGLGGVLDLLDSLLFTVPLVYFYISLA